MRDPGAERVRLVRQRSAAGAVLLGQLRDEIDPDGVVAASVLGVLQEAAAAGPRTTPGGLVLPGQEDRPDLAAVLARVGVTDAAGLWRVLNAFAASAALTAMLWAQDDLGEGPVDAQYLVEQATAFRPGALDALAARQAAGVAAAEWEAARRATGD